VGLLVAALWNRSAAERRIARSYLVAATGTAVAVLAWYMFAYPGQWWDTLQTVAYRLGVGRRYGVSPLHNLGGGYPAMSAMQMLQAEVLNVIRMIGPVALIGLGAFCIHEARRWKQRPASSSLILFCGWIFPPLLWFAIFRNQSAIHEFVAILLAPIAVYSLAICVVMLMDRLADGGGIIAQGSYWALAIFAPLLLVVPLARQIHGTVQLHQAPGGVLPAVQPAAWIMAPDDDMRFGIAIRAKAAPLSVVLTLEISAVPMYDSWRHLIQGVSSDAEIAEILPLVRREFGDAPVYLALQAKDHGKFPSTLASVPASGPNAAGDAIIVRIPNEPKYLAVER
jgi:hypothetical protein